MSGHCYNNNSISSVVKCILSSLNYPFFNAYPSGCISKLLFCDIVALLQAAAASTCMASAFTDYFRVPSAIFGGEGMGRSVAKTIIASCKNVVYIVYAKSYETKMGGQDLLLSMGLKF